MAESLPGIEDESLKDALARLGASVKREDALDGLASPSRAMRRGRVRRLARRISHPEAKCRDAPLSESRCSTARAIFGARPSWRSRLMRSGIWFIGWQASPSSVAARCSRCQARPTASDDRVVEETAPAGRRSFRSAWRSRAEPRRVLRSHAICAVFSEACGSKRTSVSSHGEKPCVCMVRPSRRASIVALIVPVPARAVAAHAGVGDDIARRLHGEFARSSAACALPRAKKDEIEGRLSPSSPCSSADDAGIDRPRRVVGTAIGPAPRDDAFQPVRRAPRPASG